MDLDKRMVLNLKGLRIWSQLKKSERAQEEWESDRDLWRDRILWREKFGHLTRIS